MGGAAGLLGRWTHRLPARLEVLTIAAYGWISVFLHGAIMNLWFWPFERRGALDWHPGLGLTATLGRHWDFYVATSLGWDAAGAITNAALILITGAAVIATFRRFAPSTPTRHHPRTTPLRSPRPSRRSNLCA
jgi:energy-coupling factor transport system substrate-specific component